MLRRGASSALAALLCCGAAAAVRAQAAATAGLDPSYECNFLTERDVSCMLPFPDNFWLRDGHLSLSNASLPVDANGDPIDPVAGGYNELQGFSPLGPVLSYIPSLNLDLSGLPRLWNISASTLSASPNSVLLDAVTLQPVQHWLELDHSGDAANDTQVYQRALMLWPATRLRDAREYIVALRRLVDDDGLPVQPSSGFAALVAGTPTGNAALEASRPRFAAIFATLAKLGWEKAELTAAWSFTTNTQADITGRFLSMRDDAFARIAAAGGDIAYSISSVVEAPDVNTSRRIFGKFAVPCYLPFDAVPSLDSHLVLDPVTRLPVFQSMTDFDFEVVIPTSVAANAKPVKVLQYGHGLFGTASEVEEGYLSAQGNEFGYVLAATDWIGLSAYDEPTVIVMLATSFTDFQIVPDRLSQGMLNALVLMKLLTQSAFTRDPAVVYNNVSVISTAPGDRHYTGNSQGGIMGSVLMAVSTDVTTGVIGVGGGPYAMLLPRSTDFSSLFDLLRVRYPRSIDRMSSISLMQALWDRMDPSGWSGYIGGGLPGTPPHRVIYQHGLGDAQVSWLGCHAIAHSTGAVMFASNAREGNETLDYFTTVADDAVLTAGSAVVAYSFGFPTVPFINVPPSDGFDAHECPRRTPAAQEQMAHFFASAGNEIINTCLATGGTCIDTGVHC